jgi:DNA-binding transcriptional regulator YiaG
MTPEQIWQLRQRLGLSQREFAEKLYVKRLTVIRWESGANKPRGIFLKLLNDLAAKAKK